MWECQVILAWAAAVISDGGLDKPKPLIRYRADIPGA